MTASDGRTRRRLDRAQVIAGGVEVADRVGLDALSMRALAAELGVVPMALYKHVADKDDLVAGMIDAVVAGYPAPDDGLGWRDSVRARTLAARSALQEHPWLRTAIERSAQRTPVVLGHMDAVAGDFIGGGVSVDLTHYAMHALGMRIWGFSPEAFSGGAPAPESAVDSAEQAAMLQLMRQRFPHVVAIAADASERNPSGACDEEVEFEFTVDLLLDAVERLHAAGWASRALR